jgi:hypothetical protein
MRVLGKDMPELRPLDIALRAEDIQTGLQDASLTTQVVSTVTETRLVGMAARLATHIRGRDVVPLRSFRAVGANLGIDGVALNEVQRVLEEAGHIRVVGQGIARQIVETVPLFEDVYANLGEIWLSRGPSEIEQASVTLLNRLAGSPLVLSEVKSQMGLDAAEHDLVFMLGEAGGYITKYESPAIRETVVYSALFWEERPEVLLEAVMAHGSERIIEAVESVRGQQGFPLPDLTKTLNEREAVLLDLVRRGLLPCPGVESLAGEKLFVFTPHEGQPPLRNSERTILRKARAIIACVRYGQHFGTVTRIQWPAAILGRLKSSGRIGPHSEIRRQYAVMVHEGIARLEEDTVYKDRHYLQVIDNDENRRALDLAIEMLRVGAVLSTHALSAEEQAALFLPGSSVEPLRGLARAKRSPQPTDAVRERLLSELVDQVREL